MPGPGHATGWNSSSGLQGSGGGWGWLTHLYHRLAAGPACRRRVQAPLLAGHGEAAREQFRRPAGESRRRASPAVTGAAPSPHPPPPRGRPLGGLTDTDYLLLLISTRAWP
jgi:hypothetical protein